MDRYLSEKDVAGITGRKLPTLRKDRLHSRGIPYLKVGRQVRYVRKDVDAFMESCRVRVKPLLTLEA